MTDEELDDDWEVDETSALALLLEDKHLLIQQLAHTKHMILFVPCNDFFEYACADAIVPARNQIKQLYILCESDSKWGALKFCAHDRNMQPLAPIVEEMKEDGAWDDVMEALKKNPHG